MSGEITVTIEGQDDVASALEEQLSAISGACRLAMVPEAEAIARLAAEKCPTETGRLRDSVRVAQTASGATVSFGGADVPYAVAVHERLDLEHANGEAKFLEKAARSVAASVAQDIAARVKTGA